jgi:uncharacterized protein (DUF433 family)
MTDQELLERIVTNPKVMAGKPVVRGTRLTAEHVLNRLAHGAAVHELLAEYEGLKAEDVQACLLLASKSLGKTA